MRAKFFARAYGVPRPLVLQNRPRFAEPAPGRLIRDRLGLADGLPIVLYQGGLQPGRGLEDLVAALPELPPCHLVLIGGGRLREALGAMAAERGLGGRVHFLPTVPLAELLAWTASADIGVQPIRNTCLNHLSTDSNKLFEYAMAGLPVVASDFPEIRRVVRAHDIGLLFDPEAPGALAAALGRLVGDAGQRARLAANARAAARALSWEAQEGELVRLYERVLGRS
jgi:glycosyltransferase involved in cell wall biosynthesis